MAKTKVLSMILTLAVTAGVMPAALVKAESNGGTYFDFDSGIEEVQIAAENNRADVPAEWARDDSEYTYKNSGCIAVNALGSSAYSRIEADFAEPYVVSDDYMVLEYKFKTDAFEGKNFYTEFKMEDEDGNSDYSQAVFIDNYDFLNAVRNKTLKSMQGLEDEWTHVLLRFNNTYCEVYINGEVYGPVAMRTVVGGYTKISGVRLGDCVWSESQEKTTYYDEIYAYPCGGLALEDSGTIGDDIVLDFNNPVDAESGAISVVRGGNDADVSVSADPIDPTRIRLTTDGSNGIYEISYEGVTDVWENTADGSVSVSKTVKLNPGDAETDDDTSWKDSSDSGSFVIHEFNTPESVSKISGALVRSEDITHMYDMSAKWLTKSTANLNFDIGTAGSKEYDFTQYGYFNIWFYSEKATGSTINIVTFSNGSTSNYQYGQFDVDWEGWKLLSIPMSSISRVVNKPDMTKVFRITFNSTGWGVTNASDECILYFERVWLSKESPAEAAAFVSAESPYGMDNMPVNNAAVVMEFDKPMMSMESAVITDGEGNEFSASVEVSGKKVRVLSNEKLLPDTEYQVSCGEAWDVNANSVTDIPAVTFTTVNAGLSVSVPKFYDNNSQKLLNMTENGDINAFTVAENLGEETVTAAITAVLCNSDGSVESIKTETAEIEPGKKKNVYASVNSKDYSGRFVVAFVTDITDGQKLAGAVYSVLGTENTAVSEKYQTEIHLNELTIAGNTGAKEKDTVLVTVTDKNGEICLQRPAKTDADGNWAVGYTFDPETATGGDYSIEVSAYGTAYSKAESIYYASKTEREELLAAANKASSADSIKSLIKKSASALELDSSVVSDDKALENICLIIAEQKPYSEFSGLVEMANKAVDTLAALNECNWSGLTEFLEKNEIVIPGDNTYYKYYTGLRSEKTRQTINQDVMEEAPFDGFEDFRDTFETAAKKAKSSETTGSSGSSGGGGGGGGTTVGAVSAKPTPTPVPETAGSEFGDLDSALWAKDSVMYLYEKNIVAMPEDAKFRPNDSITREEFVKLLVMALGVFDENAAAYFTDVAQTAWYAPYVASAKNSGITAGNEDGSFGVGQSITRQDMAAMIYRAAKDRLPAGETLDFSDAGEISAYAAEGIAALSKAGIINGVGDGRFAPKDTATRAQAAVIIYGLMTK